MSRPKAVAGRKGKGVTIETGERDIEKVIEAIRLGNIERDIRSNTARLDVRKVSQLVS
jgi:hypothetical protein